MALSLFPDPVTGRFKDQTWQALGEELQTLLSAEEYDSAKRTTFNAFYTSPNGHPGDVRGTHPPRRAAKCHSA